MQRHRRALLCTLATVLIGLPALPVLAAPQPFTDQAFQAAQAAGKPVLLDVYANW